MTTPQVHGEKSASTSDASPPEMGKVCPAAIVSGTAHNVVHATEAVVPTSRVPLEIGPLRLALGVFGGKESFAVIPGIRQVSKKGLRGEIGALSQEQLKALDNCLLAYLL